jgi:hypothetical protein
MRALTLFGIVSLTLAVAGCNLTTPEATGTERALCEAWRDSLPSRSRSDTAQTQAEIGQAYAAQAAACPRFARF